MSATHRCIDCALMVMHDEEEICPSCGRCAIHCQRDNHELMERVPDA